MFTKNKKTSTEAFFTAASHNDVSQLVALRAQGISVHTQDEAGNTALHHAVSASALESVKWLFAQHAAVDCKNKQDKTPIDFALCLDSLAILQVLLQQKSDEAVYQHLGLNVFQIYVTGTGKEALQAEAYRWERRLKTAFETALWQGKANAVVWLCETHSTLKSQRHRVENHASLSLAFTAVYLGHTEVVVQLLSHGIVSLGETNESYGNRLE